jgi:hypothetical protein
MEEKYYKFQLRDVDAWANPEGGWSWNDSHVLEEDIFFADSRITPRIVLRKLREWRFLSEESKGKVRFVEDWPVLEVQIKSTGEPILAFIAQEEIS